MLQRFAEDLWTVARAQRFWGVETGTRMAIVRMSNAGLFVHCPVRLDPELKRAVDALGPVHAVVAPSLFHHLYVADWIAAYPDAEVCPCPGLERKRSELRILEWDIDGITLAHGGLVERDGREIVREAYRWL